MESIQEKRIEKLLKAIGEIEYNDKTKIERMSKYVLESDKNVFMCLHPSAVVHYYHTHDFFEINYVYEGDCINIIEGESLHMKKGDLIIFHPGTFHTVYADSQSKVVNILIESAFFQQVFSKVQRIGESSLSLFLSRINSNSYYKYIMCNGEAVRDEITSLMEEETENKIHSNIMQEALLSVLVCKLLRKSGQGIISGMRSVPSNLMIDILLYMNEHYSSVTLSKLSEKFGYSKEHICRMFSKQTGKSFVDTLTEIKLEKAANYLESTNLKVYEIAQVLGYESSEHFHRLFKTRYGQTPYQFRKLKNTTKF